MRLALIQAVAVTGAADWEQYLEAGVAGAQDVLHQVGVEEVVAVDGSSMRLVAGAAVEAEEGLDQSWVVHELAAFALVVLGAAEGPWPAVQQQQEGFSVAVASQVLRSGAEVQKVDFAVQPELSFLWVRQPRLSQCWGPHIQKPPFEV